MPRSWCDLVSIPAGKRIRVAKEVQFEPAIKNGKSDSHSIPTYSFAVYSDRRLDKTVFGLWFGPCPCSEISNFKFQNAFGKLADRVKIGELFRANSGLEFPTREGEQRGGLEQPPPILQFDFSQY